jgi:hypothetical protein
MRKRDAWLAFAACGLASLAFAPDEVQPVAIDDARAVGRALHDPLSLLQQRSPSAGGGHAADLAPGRTGRWSRHAGRDP